MSSFLWGHWYPCFGLLVTSPLGFKARVDPSHACFVTCVQWIPEIHLWCNTCWPLGGQHGSQSRSLHACSRGRMLGFDRKTSHTVSRCPIHSATATAFIQAGLRTFSHEQSWCRVGQVGGKASWRFLVRERGKNPGHVAVKCTRFGFDTVSLPHPPGKVLMDNLVFTFCITIKPSHDVQLGTSLCVTARASWTSQPGCLVVISVVLALHWYILKHCITLNYHSSSQFYANIRTIRFLYCSYRQSFDARHAVYEINVPEQPEQEVHYVNVDVQPEGHYINIEEQPEGLYVNVNVNTT